MTEASNNFQPKKQFLSSSQLGSHCGLKRARSELVFDQKKKREHSWYMHSGVIQGLGIKRLY